jgi:hypothetical protein
MKTFWQTITLLAWALWLGGLITLFILAIKLFNSDRALAMQTVPILFHSFEIYQLALAGVTLGSAIIWKRPLLITLLAFAAAGAVATPTLITPRMDEIRLHGDVNSPEFGKLHGVSMMVYLSNAGLLALAGLALPHALKKSSAMKH